MVELLTGRLGLGPSVDRCCGRMGHGRIHPLRHAAPSSRLDASPSAGSSTEDESPTNVRPLRILLVDDNEDAVKSVEFLLSYMGYTVRGVTSGRDALQVGPDFAPDVVLLDLGMPEMDGYEVATAIQSEAWGTRTRIIALTGWGEPENVRRSKQAGFEAHLVKPLKLPELKKLLDR